MPPTRANSSLILLTGRRGAGKTTLLQKLVETARQARWTVCGLLSPARIQNDQKTHIDALDVYSGTWRLLASRASGELSGPRYGDWTFDNDTFAWGNALLEQALPCDLFVLDELGPLEFNRNQGWTAAFDLLAKPVTCRLAIVVVRPEYAGSFLHRYPQAVTVTIHKPADIDRLARRLQTKYWSQP